MRLRAVFSGERPGILWMHATVVYIHGMPTSRITQCNIAKRNPNDMRVPYWLRDDIGRGIFLMEQGRGCVSASRSAGCDEIVGSRTLYSGPGRTSGLE